MTYFAAMQKSSFTPPLHFPSSLSPICLELTSQFDLIPDDRQSILRGLIDQIIEAKQQRIPVKIIVICTHNSRRSHIGQLWLQTAALWYQVDEVTTFSGGTEATAFNHRSVKALQEVGFPIEQKSSGENPIYHCLLHPEDQAVDLYSKKFDAPANPQKDFLAILVCNEAAEACPYVPGAKARLPISFTDPKAFDDQPEESQAYLEKVKEIGREFLWVFQEVRAGLQ